MLFVWIFFAFIVLAVLCIAYLYFGRLWMSSYINQTPVPLRRIVGIAMRGSKAHIVVNSYIKARKSGLEVTLEEIETHQQAHGDVPQVVRALISAKRDGRDVPFQEACAIDLRGEDVLKAIGSPIVTLKTE